MLHLREERSCRLPFSPGSLEIGAAREADAWNVDPLGDGAGQCRRPMAIRMHGSASIVAAASADIGIRLTIEMYTPPQIQDR